MHFQKRFVFDSFKVDLWVFKDIKNHKQPKNKKLVIKSWRPYL